MNLRYLSWGAAAVVAVSVAGAAWYGWSNRFVPDVALPELSTIAALPADSTHLPPPDALQPESSLNSPDGLRPADLSLQLLRWHVRLLSVQTLDPGLRSQASVQVLEAFARSVSSMSMGAKGVGLQEAIQADLAALRRFAGTQAGVEMSAQQWLEQLWQLEQRLQAFDVALWLPVDASFGPQQPSQQNSAAVCTPTPETGDLWQQFQAWWRYSWCEIGMVVSSVWSSSVSIQSFDEPQGLLIHPEHRRSLALSRLQEARLAFYNGHTQRVTMVLESLGREWQGVQPRWWAQLSASDQQAWLRMLSSVPVPQPVAPQRTLNWLMESGR